MARRLRPIRSREPVESPPSPKPTPKSRRSHRKSRNGCSECKRRHIRCDKQQPFCFNCVTGERTCTYPPGTSTDAASEERPPSHEPPPIQQDKSHSLPVSHATPSIDDSYQLENFNSAPTAIPPFSPTDLILFHHAQTEMDYAGLGPQGQLQRVLSIAMRYSRDAPYLLDQVLGLAAIHLSMHLPSSTTSTPQPGTPLSNQSNPSLGLYANLTPSILRHHATVLQNRAVTSFTRITAENTSSTATAVTNFLFSSVLSLHTLAETFSVLRSKERSFHNFIDSFVNCFNLYRGIRAATGQPLREFLLESEELGPIMQELNVTAEVDWTKNPRGTECQPLEKMLDSASDLSAEALTVYREAVHSLQWSFDMNRGLSVQNSPHAAVAFSVTAPIGYVDRLRKYSPEALVIMAYYGVLLHRCREYWVFGDAGERMVRAVGDHLGGYWGDVLGWPLGVVKE